MREIWDDYNYKMKKIDRNHKIRMCVLGIVFVLYMATIAFLYCEFW